MFDRIVLGLGAMASAAGVSLQGMAMAFSSGPGGHPSFKISLAAIICSALGAGCLAMSPSIRGGLKPKDGGP